MLNTSDPSLHSFKQVYQNLAKTSINTLLTPADSSSSKTTVIYDSANNLLILSTPESISSFSSVDNDSENSDPAVVNNKKHRISLSPRLVRQECQCALCKEEYTGAQILEKDSIDVNIKPKMIERTGNYAVYIQWSDGHESIVAFDQLTSLYEREHEASSREPSHDH